MIFSKSFGYAVRGVLYITLMQDAKQFVQAEEIATKLGVPRHFMGKILKRLVKAGILSSYKGKTGGFAANGQTGKVLLIELHDLIDGMESFTRCALRLAACNSVHPCPVHYKMEALRNQLKDVLATTTIADLLKQDKEEFIKSIATNY